MSLPKYAQKIEVDNATVDFFKYIENGLTYYYFDTSMFGPPEPMLNGMLGLQLIENTEDILVMINHKPPMGIFPKIEENYDYEILEEAGLAKIIFRYKKETISNTDYSSNHCSG